MIVDGGIERLLPETYLHWLVMNVPGDKVEEGVEVFQYVTPFSLELEEDGSIIKDTKESSHPMLVLVFKQRTGKVAILTDITLGLSKGDGHHRDTAWVQSGHCNSSDL